MYEVVYLYQVPENNVTFYICFKLGNKAEKSLALPAVHGQEWERRCLVA